MDSKIRFVSITNPFELVNAKDLLVQSEVYSTHYERYIDALQTTFLVKEHKNGYPMRVHTRDNRNYDFKSFMNILYKYRMFPIVECARSSMMKEVCTVDIDNKYELFDVYEKLRCIDGLPECIITQNNVSKHWQIQFYLKNPIFVKSISFYNKTKNGKRFPEIVNNENNHKMYIYTIKRLAKYFRDIFDDVDIQYQGTMFRNPFNEMQTSVLYVNGRLSSLKERRPVGNDLCDLVSFLDENNIILRKNTNFEVKDIEEKIENTSRHKLTMVYAREWIWSNLRNENNISENDLFNFLIEKREEIGNICNKEPHSIREIESQVHSLYEWGVREFNGSINGSGQWKSSIIWNKNQRAAKIKKAKRIKSRFQKYLSEGYKISDIAKLFNMSRTTLYSYMALFFVIDSVETIVHYKDTVSFAGYKLWSEIINCIDDKIKFLKLKCGNCKIKWKSLNYETVSNKFVNYNLPLEGNYNLDVA